MTSKRSEDAIAPEDLLGLSLVVKRFMQEPGERVVFIECLGQLTKHNGFRPVLRLIQGLDEVIATRRGVLVILVAQDQLTTKDMALLASETTPISRHGR